MTLFASTCLSIVLPMIAAAGDDHADSTDASRSKSDWPQFRGWNARGIGSGSLPTEWDVPAGKNVKWKTPISGLGHSSPIIWGDRVYVTTSISGKQEAELRVGLYGNIEPVEDDTVHQWRVYCLDKGNGSILWEKTAHEGVPAVKRHTKATHANCTPATDGKHVVAFFGSEGLYCYSMDGELKWKKGFGVLDSGFYVVPDAQWEFASSPIIHKDRVIVQCDVQGDSFLAALDVNTGNELWRAQRDEVPTWSTPTVYEGEGRTQVIVNGFKHIGGYDFGSGKELWRMKGGGDIPVPTPIVAHGLIYVTNAHGPGAPIYAIRTSATGTLDFKPNAPNKEQFAWGYARRGTYMQTPLVYGDYLYACRDNGILTCFVAKTGKVWHSQRLGTGRTGFTASPVAGDDKLYFTSEEGNIYVLIADSMPKVLAVNPMGEVCMATPAISDGALFFRTQHHLVRIGE